MNFFEAVGYAFQQMGAILKSIVESFISVTKLILHVVSELPLMIELTTSFTADVPKYLNWLPASALSVIIITIAIIIVYKFFGRT